MTCSRELGNQIGESITLVRKNIPFFILDDYYSHVLNTHSVPDVMQSNAHSFSLFLRTTCY